VEGHEDLEFTVTQRRERGRQMQHNFTGKVIIVTGGSSGIGKATAHLFAQQGGSVLITGRHVEALKVAADHERIAWIAADISQEETASTVVARALELWGRIDVVVNNAAAILPLLLENSDTDQMYATFQTNVFGPTWLNKAALPALTLTKGTIVNITSASAQVTSVRGSGAPSSYYGASKAALEQLTRYWAVELAPRGIRVNAIAPGPTETRETPPEAAQGHNMIPSNRPGKPEDIASWIAAVADPTMKWLTGQVITVDGGIQLGAQFS
jgi:NAD(P)-dependent dehydrogenase (short-subunit alcohol dehydrogenase family)